MADGFEAILKNSSLDSKEQQLNQLSLSLELKRQQHKHEIQDMKKKLELAKKLAQQEMDSLRKLEILNAEKHKLQLELLKQQLMTVNWENLTNSRLTSLRNFVDLFDVKNLYYGQTQGREERFIEFAKANIEALEKWGLNVDSLIDFFTPLYNRLCLTDYPAFVCGTTFEILESDLKECEIKFIGFLWEAFPLPPKKLELRRNGSFESLAQKYKK